MNKDFWIIKIFFEIITIVLFLTCGKVYANE